MVAVLLNTPGAMPEAMLIWKVNCPETPAATWSTIAVTVLPVTL